MASVGDPSGPAYRNASLSTNDRVADLLPRLTLNEKAGLLFQDMLIPGPDGTLSDHSPVFGGVSTEELITSKMMNHFNILGTVTNLGDLVAWHNAIQQLALTKTRLGIPVTISTDPRNHFSDNPGTGFSAGVFSQWPEPLGFAALRDEKLVERFADIVRQEYVACGIRLALHPQIDLTTEPRWSRIAKTFGEDADLSARLARAYVRGLQGANTTNKSQSVSCMTKHFPGGGPTRDGNDPHFARGKDQVYPGGQFDCHLKPFVDAIDEGTRWIMPSYGQPIGLPGVEEVAFAFNHAIITGLLKTKLGFNGIVCSDWGVISDANVLGQDVPARAWGCEHLTEQERVKKVLEAGCDQLGGESRPDLVVGLVQAGLVDESRLDESVRKLLVEKFELGLFDNLFVDLEAAENVIGRDDFRKEGELAQRRCYTMLVNKESILPVLDLGQKKLYIEGIDQSVAEARGLNVVNSPELADLALLRLKCPHEPRPGAFERLFPDGSLEFSTSEKERQSGIYQAVPTIVDIFLERPAVIPEVAEQAEALLANYGASADAFLDVVMGVVAPEGRLPFDLARSMKAIQQSRTDVAFDTEDPVFRFGDGLRYQS